jgi:hypothetical protein
MDKDLKKLLKGLESQGYGIRYTKRGHVVVYSPEGKRLATFAGTASDWRSIRNSLSRMRRAERGE